MQLKNIIFTGLALLILSDLSEGCPPDGQRRKKRGASFPIPTAPELREKLARFFGSCPALVDSSKKIFDSLQSAVDYVIRDTNWYKNVSSSLCARPNDNVQCWIYALTFLIDERSELYKPTAKCMCKWSGKCYDPSQSTHYLVKRQVTSEIYNIPNPFTTPESSILPLPQCIEAESRRYIFRYPSLRRVDGPSIITFLKRHYTYCRYVRDFPYEQRNLFQLLYSDRLCPRSGKKAAWRKDFSTLFAEATRTDGPISASYKICRPGQCVPNPCQNGAVCRKSELDSYTCRCPSGYTGKHCEIPVDPCKPNPCKNGGKCKRQRLGKYKCVCRSGYSGEHCKERECKDGNQYLCTSLYNDEDCRYGHIMELCQFKCNSC